MRDTFTRGEILAVIVLRPCHVTGTHQPDHHTKYTCSLQLADSFYRLLELIGVETEDLDHKLHDEDCYWCHGVPAQEKYRIGRRETFAWAGVKVPKEIKAAGM